MCRSRRVPQRSTRASAPQPQGATQVLHGAKFAPLTHRKIQLYGRICMIVFLAVTSSQVGAAAAPS
jgi:hypothetical protein